MQVKFSFTIDNEWRLDDTKSSTPIPVIFTKIQIISVKVSVSKIVHLEVENKMSEAYILYNSCLQ
jgi:hypothetical protein